MDYKNCGQPVCPGGVLTACRRLFMDFQSSLTVQDARRELLRSLELHMFHPMGDAGAPLYFAVNIPPADDAPLVRITPTKFCK